MTNKHTKIGTAFLTATFLTLSTASLAFADTATDLSGNGAFSNTTVQENNSNATTLNQTNSSDINNTVNTTQNTGGNQANFNTGGSVTILTGNANAATQISNVAGTNQANVSATPSTGSVAQTGANGAFSNNSVDATSQNTTSVNQNNTSNFTNSVTNNQNTGNNQANFNTGTNVVIGTGNANSSTGISNQANTNYATVYNGVSSNDSLAALSQNGAFSTNDTRLTSLSNVNLSQNNSSWISNYVNNTQNTGDNKANYNTGGSVVIGTGDVNALLHINNQAGANSAFVLGGGSYNTIFSDVLGNGAFSSNNVAIQNNNNVNLSQDNHTHIMNDVSLSQNSGSNHSSFGTGVLSWLMSGNANAYTMLTNQAGFNNAFFSFGGGNFGGGSNFLGLLGNGAFSTNRVSEDNQTQINLQENNHTHMNNNVHQTQISGDNKADYGTGSFGYFMNGWMQNSGQGYQTVGSGDSQSWTNVMNKAGYNSLLFI